MSAADGNAERDDSGDERTGESAFGLFEDPLRRAPSPLPGVASILAGAAIASTTAELVELRGERTFARPVGFEPTTSGLEIRCSIQLSYGRRRVVVFGTNGYLEQGLEGQQALPSSRKVSRLAAPNGDRMSL
jgi:hypothetical protein